MSITGKKGRLLWCVLSLALVGQLVLSGCHSRPPLEELGELEFDVPNLPGINEPYPLPGGTSSEKTQEEGKPSSSTVPPT